MRFLYPIEITEQGRGRDRGFAAAFPDLPEAITWGDSREEALAEAVDCLEAALAERIANREELPAPSPARGRPTVAPGSLVATKAALYLAFKASGLKAGELAELMNVPASTVTRLLNPTHASKPDLMDAAFEALGARLVISLESAA